MKIQKRVVVIVALMLLAALLVACNQTTGKVSGVMGTVTVTTNPTGVMVVLTPKEGGNVVSLGETPVLNRLVSPGRYALTLQKEGYQYYL